MSEKDEKRQERAENSKKNTNRKKEPKKSFCRQNYTKI